MSAETTTPQEPNVEYLRASVSNIKKTLEELKNLPPELRQKIYSKILGDKEAPRPPACKPTTVTAYYKEKYAVVLKKILDEHFIPCLTDENFPRKYMFYGKEFCHGVQSKTLVLYFNQAWQYLNTFMDPEGKYGLLRTLVEVCRRPNGVRLEWKEMDFNAAIIAALENPLVVDPVKRAKQGSWKQRFEKFFETAVDGDRHEDNQLQLQDYDQQWIRNMCDQTDDFHILHLNEFCIRVLKDSTKKKE